MKRSILIAGLAIISITSCQKQQSPVNNKASINHENVAVIDENGNDVLAFIDPDLPCANIKHNCIEVVITGLAEQYAALDAAIAEGPTAIGDFFSNSANWVVFPDVNFIDKAALATGTYDIIKQPNSHPEAKDNYYLCGPAGTLSVANPEFVIGVTLASE